MRILIACEESQRVATAFRQKGHEAYSCDILPTSGSNPEYHLQQDVTTLLTATWDMLIAFPPCTHLSSSGARWWLKKRKAGLQQEAIAFVLLLANAPSPRIAIENPVGILSTTWRKPDQIIQPWQFGHGEVKTTCLWLKGLPLLKSTAIVSGREQRIWRMGPSPTRAIERSKTYQGIADAMAEQWG